MKRPLFVILLCLLNVVNALNPAIFYQKLKEPTPAWMKKQIEHDLNPFTYQLSQKYLDDLFATGQYCLLRVRIVSGVMSVEKCETAKYHGGGNSYLPHLAFLNQLAPLPDLDILVSGGDGIGCHPNGPALPIFALSKCKEDQGVILIPDWFALDGYEPDKSRVLNGNQNYPWYAKSDLMFFRGGDSGIVDISSFENWKKSPRPKLVGLSLSNPHLIDARFPLDLHHKKFLEQARREGYMGDFVPMNEYVRYKYLIDLDGNCASAPRLALILHSNCVPLKAVTNSVQWFYFALKPNVHYIPLKEDLSDLFTQLAWAKEHPAECQQISENAQQLAREALSQEAIYAYLYKLLREYAKRQKAQYIMQ